MKKIHGNGKAIHKINRETNKIICTYDSVVEASKDNDLTPQSIRNVCYGFNKQSGGFYWMYVDEWEGLYGERL